MASNLTKEQVKAYRLADNKVAEFAEWDMELLGDELKDILSGENLFTGFDDFETESILIGLEDTEQSLEDYVQPEEDGIKLGTFLVISAGEFISMLVGAVIIYSANKVVDFEK